MVNLWECTIECRFVELIIIIKNKGYLSCIEYCLHVNNIPNSDKYPYLINFDASSLQIVPANRRPAHPDPYS